VKNTTIVSHAAKHKYLWNCEGSFFGMDYKLLIHSCV